MNKTEMIKFYISQTADVIKSWKQYNKKNIEAIGIDCQKIADLNPQKQYQLIVAGKCRHAILRLNFVLVANFHQMYFFVTREKED